MLERQPVPAGVPTLGCQGAFLFLQLPFSACLALPSAWFRLAKMVGHGATDRYCASLKIDLAPFPALVGIEWVSLNWRLHAWLQRLS